MTHDELLAEIENEASYQTLIYALHAVVELIDKNVKHESYLWLDGFDYAMALIRLAIEKELG